MSVLARFKRDLRAPLQEAAAGSRAARLKARVRHLVRVYGWRVVAAVFVYYLVRDVVLYVVVPYLMVQTFACNG